MEYLTFSAPGRVELGGNHTDHQHGCVLAAAIDRTARARVRPTGEGVVRVFSRGYAPVELAPDDLLREAYALGGQQVGGAPL